MATSGMQLSSDASSRSDAACCGEYGEPEHLKMSLVGLAPIPWGTAGSEGYLEIEGGVVQLSLSPSKGGASSPAFCLVALASYRTEMGGESPEPWAPESLTITRRHTFITHSSKSRTWCKLPGESRWLKGSTWVLL